MHSSLPLLFAALLSVFTFGTLIVAVVVFVKVRADARRKMLDGPWRTLAHQFGGRMNGESVLVSRGAYQMTLEMRLVSVMQAIGSPFYRDGGTFTEARLVFDPRSQVRVSMLGRPVWVHTPQLRALLGENALVRLHGRARIVLSEREARVVFEGPVGDLQQIGCAFAGLEALAETIRSHGPVPVAA